MADFATDLVFLKKTFLLAKKGMGWTNPNPMVGTVIVKNGNSIAKGYHKKAGHAHAEVEAIRTAQGQTQGSTLYVNLEPCVHQGKTPPCVDAIIAAGIKRVVCATVDPNSQVHGKGIAALKEAGVAVAVGILEKEARELNEAFFTFHEKKRPFIALKFAASLDGKIATRTGDSKWITDEKPRAFARKLRSQYQAVLVGINTVIKDNPHLGVRLNGYKDSLRIILDPTLRVPLTSAVLRDSNVLIVTTASADKKRHKILLGTGISIVSLDNESISLPKLLRELRKREIISVLVEGGGTTLGSFVDERLVDKVYAFHAPLIIGGKDAVSAVEGKGVGKLTQALRLKNVTYKRFNDDLLTTGYL